MRSTAGTRDCGPGWKNEGIAYVMAVACSEMIAVPAGRFRADELAALVPAAGWQRLSCADGSKGPRLYDWALIGTAGPGHQLLARRSLHPGEKGELELAFFRCWSPRPVTLAELVAVAGARWAVEDCFAEAKNETGLDHYQVRRYRAWYRHITLSMLAHAFLAVTARQRPVRAAPRRKRGPDACGQRFAPPRTYAPPPFITDETGRDLIPLTAAEARRLFNLHTRVTRPAGIPRALVRLETLPAGQRPQIALRPPDQKSRGAVVVLVRATSDRPAGAGFAGQRAGGRAPPAIKAGVAEGRAWAHV